MNMTNPDLRHIPSLRKLWKAAFSDEDAFLDAFFSTGFSPDRCRCILEEDRPIGALYWFDVFCKGQRFAYLYAVATDPDYRGRGLCRGLMEDTASHLALKGYHGLLLVPQKESLREMYRKMGYSDCGSISSFTAPAEEQTFSLRHLTPEEYGIRRRQYLPEDGVLQEGENLTFLATYALFYEGDDFLATFTLEEGKLICHELLGNPDAAYGLVSAFGCAEGTFRTPGPDQPFAQLRKLKSDCCTPGYFALAFD